MPIQPPNFDEMLDQLVIPTAAMLEAAKLTDSGMDEAQVAEAIGVRLEVLLVWHELHCGFQALVARLAQLSDDRVINRLNVRNTLLLELDIDDIEHAAATSTPITGSRLSYRAAPDRRPRSPSAHDLLGDVVDAEYDRQNLIYNDLDFLELDVTVDHKPDRQKILVEIVEFRLAAIKYIEEGPS